MVCRWLSHRKYILLAKYVTEIKIKLLIKTTLIYNPVIEAAGYLFDWCRLIDMGMHKAGLGWSIMDMYLAGLDHHVNDMCMACLDWLVTGVSRTGLNGDCSTIGMCLTDSGHPVDDMCHFIGKHLADNS